MTLSGIELDAWVAGDALIRSNIIIVSICFLISSILFILRFFQVWLKNRKHETQSPQKMLQACHLLAMFFSCFYMFLYIWNYSHIYMQYNAMHCSLWFTLIMISITMTKVFIYSFLMLRSSLSFRNSVFKIPLKISTSVTIISVSVQLAMMTLMLSDFTAFSPFPSNAFCFRVLGPFGTFGIAGFNVSDAISAFVAFIIFWMKSKFVQTKVLNDKDLNDVFNKHIKLGMLIVLGSILIFLAGEFLTILMGVASSLHQCSNNIYIFLLFKENKRLYDLFCCKCGMQKEGESGQETGGHIERDKNKNAFKIEMQKVQSFSAESEKKCLKCSDEGTESKTSSNSF